MKYIRQVAGHVLGFKVEIRRVLDQLVIFERLLVLEEDGVPVG